MDVRLIDEGINHLLEELYNAPNNILALPRRIAWWLDHKNIKDGDSRAKLSSAITSKMGREKLIEITANHVKPLGSRGREIYEDYGGWLAYLEQQQTEKELLRESIRSSISVNKAQKWILWLTFSMATGTLVISWWDYKTHQAELELNKNNQLLQQAIQKDLDRIDSLDNILKGQKAEINALKTEVLKLQTPTKPNKK